jgi:hypothetical protein
MIRWLRVVLPSLEWLVLFAALYGLATGIMLAVEWWFGVRLEEVRWQASRAVLVFATVLYATWRVLAYHPLSLPEYQTWLAATPWTSRQPLPLGPVHLVLQDVVLLGSGVLCAWLNGDPWALYVPQLFLVVYLWFLGSSLFWTGVWPCGYAVAFGVGLVVWLWRDLPAGLLVALLTYGVAYLGLRRSLAHFPWPIRWPRLAGTLGATPQTQSVAAVLLGWPFGRLSPRNAEPPILVPLHHAVLISALVGWWTFAVVSLVPKAEDQQLVLLFVLSLVALAVPGIRLGIYCDGYAAPISLLGRLATGRWLIPGYDQVFVAPLLAVAAGSTLGGAAILLGLDLLVALPVVIAVVLFLSLGLGPSLQVWRLTGNHRIVEGSQRAGTVKVG